LRETWRKYFKPGVKVMVETTHDCGLPVVDYSCRNVCGILDGYVGIGMDDYHLLEVTPGLDVAYLRRIVGHTLTFMGNNDVRLWAEVNRVANLQASVAESYRALAVRSERSQ